MTKRYALLIYVDLADPVAGQVSPEAVEEIARQTVQNILEEKIDRYKPIVSHAPESLQPSNPEFTRLRADDIHTIYTEGTTEA